MARIKWKANAKLLNKAIGLPGPDVGYKSVGDEMDVPDSALPKLEKRYGADAFEILKAPAPPPKKGGRK